MMNSPDEVVTRFCALWSKPDLDEIASCFTEDAVYRNIPPTPSVEGREAIREFIAEFLATLDGIDFIVHRQISDHGVVMHERTDVLRRKDGVEISAKMLCRSGVSRRPVSALAEHSCEHTRRRQLAERTTESNLRGFAPLCRLDL
jgi:limonene-1,2-epoxide hydrolase